MFCAFACAARQACGARPCVMAVYLLLLVSLAVTVASEVVEINDVETWDATIQADQLWVVKFYGSAPSTAHEDALFSHLEPRSG